MGRSEAWTRRYWGEPQPEIKELTDTERLDFLDEYVLGVSVKEKTPVTIRQVTITCEDVIGKGIDWREAIDIAYAKFWEINHD